jgi:hypothetical protein
MTTRRAQIRITASRSPARGVQTGGNDLPEAAILLTPDVAARATGPPTPEAAAEMGRQEARTRGERATTGVAPPLHAPERLGRPRGIGWWPAAIRRAYEEGYRAEVLAQEHTVWARRKEKLRVVFETAVATGSPVVRVFGGNGQELAAELVELPSAVAGRNHLEGALVERGAGGRMRSWPDPGPWQSAGTGRCPRCTAAGAGA